MSLFESPSWIKLAMSACSLRLLVVELPTDVSRNHASRPAFIPIMHSLIPGCLVSGTTFLLLLIFLDVHNPKTAVITGLKAVDWFGSLSILAMTLMLLLGLEFGGATFPVSMPTRLLFSQELYL
jgi:hypothetical protein